MSGATLWRFAGREFEQRQALGEGGQGTVYQAHQAQASVPTVIKVLPNTPAQRERLHYLLDQRVGYAIPGVSAPLALADQTVDGQVAYLALQGMGVSLEDD